MDAYQRKVQESLTLSKFYQEDMTELVEIESISKYNSCPNCQQKIKYSDTQKILQYVRCYYKKENFVIEFDIKNILSEIK